MGYETEEIEGDIEIGRANLRENFEELHDKVRSAADWRHHFRNNTGVALALAFGGGLVLAKMLLPRQSAANAQKALPHNPTPGGASARGGEMRQNWRSIESALIGVAANKVKDILAALIPGFREQLSRGDARRP